MTGINYADLFYSKHNNDIASFEEAIKEQPVSSLSQFLLLYHYKRTNDERFEKLAGKTALYFNNPNWLQFQLEQTGLQNEIIAEPKDEPIESGHFAVLLPKENNSSTDDLAVATENEVEKAITPEETDNDYLSSKENEEAVNVDELTHEDNASQPELLSEVPNEQESSEINSQEIVPDEPVNENNEIAQDSENSHSTSTIAEEVAFEPKEELLEDDRLKNEMPLANESHVQEAFEPKVEIAEVAQDTPANKESIFEENKEKNPSADVQAPTLLLSPQNDEPLAFEPLHTVDYFASQGIKIREDMLTNDKLGKQMRSFTDWLKSMKKLHPGKMPEQNEVIERIIQSSAEESNADAEVLTEAMAEVLIKQNKREKAIEMYEKLSLMNPSKSTYFAAKIDSIKTI